MSKLLAIACVLLFAIAPVAGKQPEADAPARIVAVGDLHGDHSAWLAIAQEAGLVDASGSWAGGRTALVQMGDVTDRGPDSLKIIRHLQQLQREAAEAGGEVIVLLGNHEAMNVIGDLRYVHPGEYAAFEDRDSMRRREATWQTNRNQIAAAYRELEPGISERDAKRRWFESTPLGMLEHRRAWRAGGELGAWAAGLPAVVKLGDTLFAHGGLSAERTTEQIEAINARHRTALSEGEGVDRSVLDDPLGPLWYRGNVVRDAQGASTPERATIHDELETVLARYDARRLIVGHTPSLGGIAGSSKGRLIRADTGIARHYGGPASFLVIEGGRLTAHRRSDNGSWSARDLSAPEAGAWE